MEYQAKVIMLEQLYGEARSLLEDTNLSNMQFWHARSRGKLEAIFPNRKDIIEHWKSIDFDWEDKFQFYSEILGADYQNSVPVPEAVKEYDDESIPEDEKAFAHYYWHRAKWCKDALLGYVSIVESERLGMAPIEGTLQPRPEIPPLGFIENTHLKQIVHRRMTEALHCSDNRAYLPAVIMLGSALEAMLLGLAKDHEEQVYAVARASAYRFPRHPNGDLMRIEDWNFFELTEISYEYGWIKDEGRRMANELRKWRNLIHPGLEHLRNALPNNENVHLDESDFRRGWSAIGKCISEINAWQPINEDLP